MSSNYPYQRSLPDSDLRPAFDLRPDSDLRPDPRRSSAAPDANLYRRPQESFPAPSYSLSSSRGSAAPQLPPSSQDGVLGILSSCGLEPEDLSVLAKLPEDVLTVESLPQILKQIKGKRGSGEPLLPPAASSSSFPSSFAPRPVASFSHRERDEQHSQLVRYPLGHISSSKSDIPSNRWESASTFSAVRSPPSSSSSFRHQTDYDYRPRHSDYGKTALTPTAGPASQVIPSRASGLRPPEHRAVPPANERRPKPWEARSSSRFSPGRSSRFSSSMPSKKEAQDFHGTAPDVYPYSCSLCDITVLSERAWTQHTTCTQHADGQLKLLQRFPHWDCRLENISSDDSKSDRWKDEGTLARPAKRAEEKNPDQNQAPQSHKAPQKASDKGKVVCVKFPAQSVDEAYLRKLTEPFGKILQILMFPSLAFVELGSIDQAKDLVKFHTNYPPTVNGKQMEFSISSTFSFLQSSQVVSFIPAPEGKDGYSDLMSIVKRFGAPLYTLVLPSKVFVEMKSSADAQKLVNYYSSNKLKINDDIIQVAFSNEYKSLLTVALAKKYEEEEPTKDSDPKPRSGDRDRKRTRTRSRSRSKGRSRDSKSSRTRSRSRQRSEGSKSSRSRERSRRHCRSRSRSKERSERKKRSRTRSRSKEPSSNSSRQNQNRGNSKEPEPPLRVEPPTITGNIQQKGPAGEDEEDSMSANGSDKGMEVIAEDGRMITEEDEESLKEEEHMEENRTSEEMTASSEREEEKKMETEDEEKTSVQPEEMDVKDAGAEDQEQLMTEEKEGEEERPREMKEEETEEAGFPLNLEDCITLDEVHSDDEGEGDGGEESQLESSRVVSFSAVPQCCTDAELVKVMRGFGTVVRYLSMRDTQQAFVEMSSPSEAQTAAEELNSNCISVNGCRLIGSVSREHTRLTDGWDVKGDEDEEGRSEQSDRRSETQKPRTSEPEGSTSEEKPSEEVQEGEETSQETPSDKTEENKTEGKEARKSKSQTHEEEITASNAPKVPEDKNPPEDQDLQQQREAEKLSDSHEPEGRDPERADHPETADQNAVAAPPFAPAGGATEAERLAKAVGAEFVRPVVGYYCNLCQLIFSDEDEAKGDHCRTPAHYAKYQEKTGKDPWTS